MLARREGTRAVRIMDRIKNKEKVLPFDSRKPRTKWSASAMGIGIENHAAAKAHEPYHRGEARKRACSVGTE